MVAAQKVLGSKERLPLKSQSCAYLDYAGLG
jgi:hypothetical protein